MSDLTYADWADAVVEGRLLGQACDGCGHVAGAPKAACARCGSRDLETVELSTEGEVYSETTVAVPPIQFEADRYQVALVQLGEARVMARLAGDGVGIGDRVVLADYIDEDEGRPAPVFEAA